MRMFVRNLAVCLLLSSLLSFSAFSQDESADQFKIAKVTVREVSPERRDDEPKPPTLDDQLNTASHVIGVTSELVALGKDAWDLFEKGRPVKSVELNPINILPRNNGEIEWIPLYEMYGWSMPVVKTYKVEFENFYGVTVCSFKFSIEYQYGGKTEGVNGRYLAAINIVPNTVSLKWGFSLDAGAKFIGATNMSQTPDFVMAAGRFQIDYQVSSLMSTEAQSISFFILANGNLQMLSH